MLFGIIILNTELNKRHFLRDEMIFMHCSLHLKQNIYVLSRHFRAPVVTQFKVKVKRKLNKFTFLKVYNFSIRQHFLNVKV